MRMHKLFRRLDLEYDRLRLELYSLINLTYQPSQRQKVFKSNLDSYEFSKREIQAIKVLAMHGLYDEIYSIFN